MNSIKPDILGKLDNDPENSLFEISSLLRLFKWEIDAGRIPENRFRFMNKCVSFLHSAIASRFSPLRLLFPRLITTIEVARDETLHIVSGLKVPERLKLSKVIDLMEGA